MNVCSFEYGGEVILIVLNVHICQCVLINVFVNKGTNGGGPASRPHHAPSIGTMEHLVP